MMCIPQLRIWCEMQMKAKRTLIPKLKRYEFELDLNVAQKSKQKKICYAKVEGAVDHIIAPRWFQEFRLSCKNLDDQARPSRPKNTEFQSYARSPRQIQWVAPWE